MTADGQQMNERKSPRGVAPDDAQTDGLQIRGHQSRPRLLGPRCATRGQANVVVTQEQATSVIDEGRAELDCVGEVVDQLNGLLATIEARLDVISPECETE